MTPLIIAIIITFFDQLTKQWIRLDFALGETRPVIEGFLNLNYLRNTGAAWGMLTGQNTALIIISVFMLCLMIIFRKSFVTDRWDQRIAFGLMFGGIIGNLMDRIRLGWVTDFLDFHIAGYHWPSFNIADSAICIGVGMYMVSSGLTMRDTMNNSTGPIQEKDAG
ncbi:MAG: signal peptidase II [Kiritimatiellae bacterium]|nr:signal peptidase II [Kiritimatiellia bacterium]